MGSRVLVVPAVQVKVTLEQIAPPIWRRLVVPGDWDLGQLHKALQIAFAWADSHLHAFEVGDDTFGDDESGEDEVEPERDVRVREVLDAPGKELTYEYDFGDSWRHRVVMEEQLEPTKTARCLAGERSAPPEDSGGSFGYLHSLEVLADPTHPEYDEVHDWFGADWDPEAVDLERINRALARLR